MRLFNIANWRQPRAGDCLPACVAMVFAHAGIQVNYTHLRQRLRTLVTGTPFSNVDQLRSWWLVVERGRGDHTTLQKHLTAGQPVIVAVATEFLPYWLTRSDINEAERLTEHAIVVTGLEDQIVYVNDPDFDTAPQIVDLHWFIEAWQGQSYHYAVIQRRQLWRLF